MRNGICLGKLFGIACLSLLLAGVPPHGAIARAEAKAIDVLPGAFGESIDALDDATSGLCIEYADRALQKMLEDFAQDAVQAPGAAYLQILQTTLLLPESLPPDANNIDRAIWAELYEDALCVVSFVTIDNSLNFSDVLYADHTGSFGDYIVRKDGSVEKVLLRAIRSRFFAGPIVPGVRVINMGSHYNTHYTFPKLSGMESAQPLSGDTVNSLRLGQFAYVTLE